jgi:hypothetical protein
MGGKRCIGNARFVQALRLLLGNRAQKIPPQKFFIEWLFVCQRNLSSSR